MPKYVIIALIIIYSIYVIYRKVKNIKKGKLCECGCDDCPIKDKCEK